MNPRLPKSESEVANEARQIALRRRKSALELSAFSDRGSDLMATIYRKLGIDYQKEYLSNIGRPVKLTDDGKPLDFLLG